MMNFSHLRYEHIVQAALEEDLNQGDVTTEGLEPLIWGRKATGRLYAKEPCVVSGLKAASLAFMLVDPNLKICLHTALGQAVEPNTLLLEVTGESTSILKAERTALNFLQHLCGIATHTRRYLEALNANGETETRLTHTRKTTPGMRLVEQQAVMDGGGSPHRSNLGQAAMLKDNHIAAAGGDIEKAVRTIRQRLPHTNRLEVEVDRIDQIPPAVSAGADILLLDNMTPAQVKEAVALVKSLTPQHVILEISGGIYLETIGSYAHCGADVISTSQITLGAPSIDIGLDLTLLAATQSNGYEQDTILPFLASNSRLSV